MLYKFKLFLVFLLSFALSPSMSISAVGDITTVAGTGSSGFSGDGGPATSATFNTPGDVDVDSAGNIYVADANNNRVRKIDAITGNITTVAGTGDYAFSGEGGLATDASFGNPFDVALDGNDNLYIAATDSYRILKVDAITGIITTVAGIGSYGSTGDGGLGIYAAIGTAWGMDVDLEGNVYIADASYNKIRRVDAITGIITTVAGSGVRGGSGDGGLAINATLHLRGVYVDPYGHIYISDLFNSRVRKVDADTGIITTIAGNGVEGNYGDGGLAINAAVKWPSGAALGVGNNLYIAGGAGTDRIRSIDMNSGVITAFAGTGTPGYFGDGGAAISAQFDTPINLTFDPSGNMYIADMYNNSIRKIEGPFSSDKLHPVTTATPGGGMHIENPMVALTCVDIGGAGCLGTYYTVDGSEPDTGSMVYTTMLTIDTDTTLKFFSMDSLGNKEPVQTEIFTLVNNCTAAPNAPEGVYNSDTLGIPNFDYDVVGNITIYWDANTSPADTDIVNYNIYREVSSDGGLSWNGALVQTAGSAATSVVDSNVGVPLGAFVRYYVTAVDSCSLESTGSWSAPLIINGTCDDLPTEPTGLQTNPVDQKGMSMFFEPVTLNWTVPSTPTDFDIVKYRVYTEVSADGLLWSPPTFINEVEGVDGAPPATTYLDMDPMFLFEGDRVRYSVTAVDYCGIEGSPSSTTQVMIVGTCEFFPVIPTDVVFNSGGTVDFDGSGNVTLDWNSFAPINDVVQFNIYRELSSDGLTWGAAILDGSVVGDYNVVPASTYTANNTGISTGVRVRYLVTAVNYCDLESIYSLATPVLIVDTCLGPASPPSYVKFMPDENATDFELDGTMIVSWMNTTDFDTLSRRVYSQVSLDSGNSWEAPSFEAEVDAYTSSVVVDNSAFNNGEFVRYYVTSMDYCGLESEPSATLGPLVVGSSGAPAGLKPNDLIVEFGAGVGLWAYLNDASWTKLSSSLSEDFVIGDINGNNIEDLIVDFGAIGIWVYYDNSSWTKISSSNAEGLAVGDINGNATEELVVDFGAVGVWTYYDDNYWTKISSSNAEGFAIGDFDGSGIGDLTVDFGAVGLWTYYNDSSWTKTSASLADSMVTADLNGNNQDDLIVDFGVAGVWAVYDNAGWVRLSTSNPESMAVGNLNGAGSDEVVFDFGAIGLWVYYDNSSWTKISSSDADQLTTGDLNSNGSAEVIVSFPGVGTWVKYDDGSWTKISGSNPLGMSTGDIDGN